MQQRPQVVTGNKASMDVKDFEVFDFLNVLFNTTRRFLTEISSNLPEGPLS